MKTLRIAARVVVGLVLAHGAGMLLLHPSLPGYDGPFAAIALAAAEIAAAVLFAIPRTAFAGGVALLIVLAWAAGFHAGIGHPARLLFLWMALVGTLTFTAPRSHTA